MYRSNTYFQLKHPIYSVNGFIDKYEWDTKMLNVYSQKSNINQTRQFPAKPVDLRGMNLERGKLKPIHECMFLSGFYIREDIIEIFKDVKEVNFRILDCKLHHKGVPTKEKYYFFWIMPFDDNAFQWNDMRFRINSSNQYCKEFNIQVKSSSEYKKRKQLDHLSLDSNIIFKDGYQIPEILEKLPFTSFSLFSSRMVNEIHEKLSKQIFDIDNPIDLYQKFNIDKIEGEELFRIRKYNASILEENKSHLVPKEYTLNEDGTYVDQYSVFEKDFSDRFRKLIVRFKDAEAYDECPILKKIEEIPTNKIVENLVQEINSLELNEDEFLCFYHQDNYSFHVYNIKFDSSMIGSGYIYDPLEFEHREINKSFEIKTFNKLLNDQDLRDILEEYDKVIFDDGDIVILNYIRSISYRIIKDMVMESFRLNNQKSSFFAIGDYRDDPFQVKL